MITLHRHAPASGPSALGMFCAKVETYLRMAGLEFRSVVGDVRQAPKGKLPYVDDDGRLVCGSRDIIAHFETKSQAPLDAGLTSRQRALTVAFRALIEEEAYFYASYMRGQGDDWRSEARVLMRHGRAPGLPGWLASLRLRSARKKAVRAMRGHGGGRLGRNEIDARLYEATQVICEQLRDGPYFLGSEPHVIDASVYAYLSVLSSSPVFCRAQELVRANAPARTYRRRMQAHYSAEAPAYDESQVVATASA